MTQHLKQISILVDDYDKAIKYYTEKLHFHLIEDTILSDTKRWVIVGPAGSDGCALLLAKASNDIQKSRIGNQTGGRVFLFLHTDNFKRDYQNLINKQIKIVREPSLETYGTVAVFEDIYGNLWDLIEPNKSLALLYITQILKIKDNKEPEILRNALSHLRMQSIKENGCILFDIHEVIEEPGTILLHACYKNVTSYKAHLSSTHFHNFSELNLVEIKKEYSSQKVSH
jgi:quinol monooxygenase YgiN/uncharacterized glyoxalase superfamily protein PhnB